MGFDKGIDKADKYFPSWLPSPPLPTRHNRTENGSFNETRWSTSGPTNSRFQRWTNNRGGEAKEQREREWLSTFPLSGFRWCHRLIDDEKENRRANEAKQTRRGADARINIIIHSSRWVVNWIELFFFFFPPDESWFIKERRELLFRRIIRRGERGYYIETILIWFCSSTQGEEVKTAINCPRYVYYFFSRREIEYLHNTYRNENITLSNY